MEKTMADIKIYEINAAYVDYLVPHAPLLFHNKKPGQTNERKYIGIVLTIHGLDYFAPLSSFKPKHNQMKETLDFLKIDHYAVINLNCMFPVPASECSYVDFSRISDRRYRSLLLAEYRIIHAMQEKIRKNAASVYKHKLVKGDSTPLAKRCNDFELLETLCAQYHQ